MMYYFELGKPMTASVLADGPQVPKSEETT